MKLFFPHYCTFKGKQDDEKTIYPFDKKRIRRS